MALTSGTRIGPFEIVEWIGGGGMGEVYRARDLRLGRDVAIKMIAERFAQDSRRVQRFEQEACAAGQLDHPNVLAVHDVGVHDGTPFIVSELLVGESLRARLRHGALPLRQAIDYARQTADGLAAAHAKRIIHRDLKPENLFITSDNRVKILDFGLAKLSEANDDAFPAGADTEVGSILGTINYMSPEQVRGERVDVRTDVFSLGITLQEMLTGVAPFVRATPAETMAAILKDDAAASLPDDVPPAVARLVGRCLEKNRDTRFQSARDLAFGLDGLSQADVTDGSRAHARSWTRAHALPWIIVITLATTLAAVGRRSSPPNRAVAQVRLTADLGADAPLGTLAMQFGNAIAISPDGSTLAFVTQRNIDAAPLLYVRRLGETRATMLAGTENANAPFFSPDGAWIGFDGGPEQKLKKVAVTGGAPIAVAPEQSFRGASWSGDGALVFAPAQTPGVTLMRLAAAGSLQTPLTTLGPDEAIHVWPQVLPGDAAVLYTSGRVAGAFNDANLVVQPLPSGTPTVVQRGAYHGVYVRSGHIVYIHDGTLFALPFDLTRLEPTGPSVRVLDNVASNALTGGAQFSVSDGGILVYLSGPSVGTGTPIDLVDRQGRTTPLRTTVANWMTPAFASDGRRLALAVTTGPSEAAEIWVHEAGRETLARVTSDPARDTTPVWTADGRRVTFASNRGGDPTTSNLYWQLADGSGNAQRLTTSGNDQQPGSWHPSGRFLAFDELRAGTKRDVMILPMTGGEASGWTPGVPAVFVASPGHDWGPRFSPDGRWLAYASNESGRREVYVRPFPGPGAAVRISSAGGELPAWSATRQEIVYGFEGQVMIAPYTVRGPNFVGGTPRPWPGARYQTRGRNGMFDLHPDGDHVALALAPAPAAGTTHAQFVFNFFDDLHRLAPASTGSR